MKALHELDKDEYVKHLEDMLLGTGTLDYARCLHCKRAEGTENMTEQARFEYVCDTCLLAWERAEKKAQEIAASDEKDYRGREGESMNPHTLHALEIAAMCLAYFTMMLLLGLCLEALVTFVKALAVKFAFGI